MGVYDGGADGLATSHPIALWRYLGVNQGELLANAVVSAGTSAPLVDGYRYSSITPVAVPPQSIIVVGAQYAQSDPDNNVIPFTGTVAPALKFAGSLGTPGPNLPMPAGGYSQGEGSPNYAFFPVNFQFQIIPEPPPWLVLASGLALFLLKAAEENYREWNEKKGTP